MASLRDFKLPAPTASSQHDDMDGWGKLLHESCVDRDDYTPNTWSHGRISTRCYTTHAAPEHRQFFVLICLVARTYGSAGFSYAP